MSRIMMLIIGDIFCIWIVIFSTGIFKLNFNEDVVSCVRLRMKLLRQCYCYVDTPLSGGGSNNNNLIIIVVVVVVVVLLLVFVVVVVIVVLRRRREYSHYNKLFTNVIYNKQRVLHPTLPGTIDTIQYNTIYLYHLSFTVILSHVQQVVIIIKIIIIIIIWYLLLAYSF